MNTSTSLLLVLTLINNINLIARQTVAIDFSRQSYINLYKHIAVEEMSRTGIPASITLGQAILESNAGQSNLARKANNHFGIKCGGNWNGKRFSMHSDEAEHRDLDVNFCYRKYRHAKDSYKDHSEILSNPLRYGFLFHNSPFDYAAWSYGLQTAGYATSDKYAKTLIGVIENCKLYDYDKMGNITPSINLSRQRYTRIVNHSKMILTKPTENLEEIARIYEIPVESLVYFNESFYDQKEILADNTRIYLQKKRKKLSGRIKFHYVKKEETLFSIAQQYGISLQKLRNINKLSDNEEPVTGTRIRLKGTSLFQAKPLTRITHPLDPLSGYQKEFTFEFSLLFDIGQSDLSPSALAQLQNLSQFLVQNPPLKATISGHTDDLGNSEENRLLSEKRAKTVFDLMVQNKVAPQRLSIIGWGEEKHLVENSTDAQRALNRRVVVQIYP